MRPQRSQRPGRLPPFRKGPGNPLTSPGKARLPKPIETLPPNPGKGPSPFNPPPPPGAPPTRPPPRGGPPITHPLWGVIVPSWIGRQRKSSRHMPVAGRSNAHLNTVSSSWVWRTPPIVSAKPSSGLRPWRCSSTAWWWFGFTKRVISLSGFPSGRGTQEGRTIIRRHVDDPATGQLRRENRATASKTVCTENLDRPAHRASQPDRVSGATDTDTSVGHSAMNDLPRGFSPTGPRHTRLNLRN